MEVRYRPGDGSRRDRPRSRRERRRRSSSGTAVARCRRVGHDLGTHTRHCASSDGDQHPADPQSVRG
jgi:hypothetical protein